MVTMQYQYTGKKQEWTCVLYAEPSIFQPETDMEVTALASHELAKQSQRKSLKPGDRVMLIGIMRTNRLSFPTRESKTMYRIALTQVPQMVAKEKRVSTTVFEQRQKYGEAYEVEEGRSELKRVACVTLSG